MHMQTERITALIIDDSKIIRDRLEELLFEVNGVSTVIKAASAREGLELAAAGKPLLVVLDIRMPDICGIDILEHIKQTSPAPVVAVLTNYPDESYRRRCLELGADYFFDKSSEFFEIRNIMKNLIDRDNHADKTHGAGMKSKSIKILLAEDNELNRDMLSRRLLRKGYEVVLAVDGEEALAKVMTEHPDLILMDLRLPEVDGWEVTRRLKGDNSTCHIPVIAITAHAMQSDRESAFAAGCDDYDIKPIDFPRLLEKIEGQLHGGHAL
jgi:CheY-like chemotaxis protein